MALTLGLLVGVAFGIASAFAGRRWGTVLACVPITVWFIVFVALSIPGLRDDQVAPLCFALLGIVLGLLSGQVIPRPRSRVRSVDKP